MTSIQKYELEQLESGGRVISEKLPSVRSISLGFWIGAGSRHEQPAENGISHFLEHLLFKGSSRYSAMQIAQIFDSFGGELNAATAREYTVVHARFLDRHLEDAFEVMADMVLRPSFSEVDPEREVVVEEIAMYEDSPGDLVSDYLTQCIFGTHPLGKPVLGTSQIIGNVPLDTLRAYHAGHYTLPNMVIASAGNVEQEQLVTLAREHLAGGNGERAMAQLTEAPAAPAQAAHGATFHKKDTQQYHVCIGGLGLSRHSERRYALSILDAILGSSASSRLFQEVREKRGLVYSIYTYSSLYSETGLVGIYFGCRRESVAEVTAIVARELQRMMEEPVSDEELVRARESAKGRLVLGMETTHSRMTRLGKLSVTNSKILSIDEIMDRIDRVTADDVMQLAREFYRPPDLAAVGIGPDPAVFEQAVESLGGRREVIVKEG